MADFTDLLGGFGTTPPEYLGGLLGQDAVDQLKKQAMGTGIINTALAYLAAPKNQNLGLGRIVGQSLMAGQQGAQGVYTGALEDWQNKQKVEQQLAQQQALLKIGSDNPELANMLRAYPSAAPAVLEKLYTAKEAKPTGRMLTEAEVATAKLPTDQGQVYQLKPDNTIELVPTGKQESLTNDYKNWQSYIADEKSNNRTPLGFNDWMLQQKKAGAQTVSVTTKGEGKYQEVLGGKLAENNYGIIQAGQAAPDQIAAARRIKDTLDKNPITGAGAPALQSLNNVLSTAGIIDPTKGINTQALVSDLSKITLQNIKTSGLGTGQGFTDKDLRFLNDAVSGSIEWNAANIRRVADLNERAGLKAIEKHNNIVKRLTPDQRQMYGTDIIQSPIPVGQPIYR